jgi:hypothetical protein
MTKEERRAYNQRQHAQQRQALAGDDPQRIAELWWDLCRKIARDRAAQGDAMAWVTLGRTLQNFHDGYAG